MNSRMIVRLVFFLLAGFVYGCDSENHDSENIPKNLQDKT